MNRITLDMTNILVETIGREGLEKDALQEVSFRLERYNKTLVEAPYPFMELSQSRFEFPEMERLAQTIRSKSVKNLVLLGIGGSSLGTETIFNALLHPFHNTVGKARQGKPRYFILDNIDPHKINRVIEIVGNEIEDTLFIVISKSGETPETISQFMIFKELQGVYTHIRELTVIVTDKLQGILKEIVEREGYPVLHVPEGVGGRFSVLTPVGLFPSAVMGININEMTDGARDMADHIRQTGHRENMAITWASILYLMEKGGKHIHVMMPYCERLSGFASWFKQLEAESLGKKGHGPTPLRSIGVTDQHSQLQLYIDGPKDKCIIFVSSATEKRAIPNSFPYLDTLDYLAGKDLGNLFHAELAGTRLSLTEAGTPNLTISLDEINAYNLGSLFFLCEMVVTFLGHLYEVNPFDQPGVELGKIYTKAIMGKKGLEKEKKRIDESLLAKKAMITF